MGRLWSRHKTRLAELEEREIIVKETEPTKWISSMISEAKSGKICIFFDPRDQNKATQIPSADMGRDAAKTRISWNAHFLWRHARMVFSKSVYMIIAANLQPTGPYLEDKDTCKCYLESAQLRKSSKVPCMNDFETYKVGRESLCTKQSSQLLSNVTPR